MSFTLISARPYRFALLFLTLLSVLWFPWALSVFLIFASGLIFPPLALFFGILVDTLYYPGQGYYFATLLGAFLMLITYLVRHFVKTRIM